MATAGAETSELPIGVFDSGVGGLTVLSALRKRLPRERYIYLGDTARLPYGTKSRETIVRYALQAAEKLVERRIKLLVTACNTATAAALPDLRQAFAPLTVIGVVEPGARAACRVIAGKKEGGNILILGTESTVDGQAYTEAIHALRPDAVVRGVACTLFVSMAEEGWMTGPVIEITAARYLAPVIGPEAGQGRFLPDCIVLGCTHFPPLAGAVASVAGPEPVIIDSAETTAEAVEEELTRLNLLRPAGGPEDTPASDRFLTTDAPERFARVGGIFLNECLDPANVELVSLSFNPQTGPSAA
ncbi:MAG: glutamate racemase [Desulfovibrio sp.]|jgi:glutamate racemase|nr:glutamate racemase [Desulfovibrio sp.]